MSVSTDALVTVNQVDVTPDLKNAHVYVSVLGRKERKEVHRETWSEPQRTCRPDWRSTSCLKYTPHLVFHLDDSIERGARVFEILQQIGTCLRPSLRRMNAITVEDRKPA